MLDTTVPAVTFFAATGASVTNGNGSLNAGQTITFVLDASEAVTVAGGTPTLALSNGGFASFDAGSSTPTSLVFAYTVTSGEDTADLAVTAGNLNGATIADSAGNTADLSSAVGNPPGVLQIDTTAPTVTSVAISPSTGTAGTGQVVTLTVATSEAVTVAGGTPTLALSNGGTATYDPASSTPTLLAFTYTVEAGQDTADLAITGTSLNGATIVDSAGNTADMTGTPGNPPGVLGIDTSEPAVIGVTASPATSDLGIGQTAVLTLAISEAVIVAGGTPTLLLDSGGVATFNAVSSTPTALAFTYTVAAGENAADLTVAATALNGAMITDAAGNAANLALAVGNLAGTLQIDGTTPVVTAVSSVPGTGTLRPGQAVSLVLTTSEAVTIAGGTPTLTLDDGGVAVYDAAASTPTGLVFTYTVASGQNTADLAITAANLNGATVADGAGDAASLATVLGTLPGTLQVDTTVPSVVSLTATPDTADLGIGQAVTFTAAASEAVTVIGGTPTLSLNDGGTAIFDAVASTPTSLVFTYTVAFGQNTADLAVTAANLNGATVVDGAGNAADLSGAVGNPAGTLQVDTAAPIVTGIATSPRSGAVGAGRVVTLTLTTSEAVTVAGGTPTLSLGNGGTATFDAASSTRTRLAFTYAVALGQDTADLAIIAANLNGASVVDGAGNTTKLSGAVGSPPGVLKIDTTAPTVRSVAASPSTGTGQAVIVTLAISEAVTVAGGTPTLALSNGGTATYDPASSTPTGLAFTYTVGTGQSTANLTVTGTSLNGATIADSAGNAISLSSAIGTLPPPAAPNNFHIQGTTTNVNFDAPGDNYTGPVADLQHQYINITTDDLNITALVPDVFIHTGSGTDAIDVSRTNGINVLDGGTGSNFLVGGSGMDTFFVDDRMAAADIWSTVSNFHAGDAVTLYGITATGFALDWEDNQGAAGYTGLTLHAIAAGKPIASMTIAGYSTSDLSSGRLTVLFGTDPASQSDYMFVHGN